MLTGEDPSIAPQALEESRDPFDANFGAGVVEEGTGDGTGCEGDGR